MTSQLVVDRLRCIVKFALRLFAIGTGIIIMTASAIGAPSFVLKAPEQYFSDPRSLALLRVAHSGDLALARQMVADGADPNDEGPKESQYQRLRLLHYAIAANDTQAVRTLVAVGADPELKAEGYGRAFLFAVTLDKVDMLSLLLDLKPISTLSKDTLERMMFESLSLPGRRSLELLLKRGVPIDIPNRSGYTILMDALDVQDYDLAEWLLLQGASVKSVSNGGMTVAYLVQFHLSKFKAGTPTYNKVLHLKELMEERGAVFPALSPKEIRELQGKK